MRIAYLCKESSNDQTPEYQEVDTFLNNDDTFERLIKEFQQEEGMSDEEIQEMRNFTTEEREEFIRQYLEFESSIKNNITSTCNKVYAQLTILGKDAQEMIMTEGEEDDKVHSELRKAMETSDAELLIKLCRDPKCMTH